MFIIRIESKRHLPSESQQQLEPQSKEIFTQTATDAHCSQCETLGKEIRALRNEIITDKQKIIKQKAVINSLRKGDFAFE